MTRRDNDIFTWAAEGVEQVGDAESSLGDAKSSLGDATSSLGDAESSLGAAKSSLGDAESSLGDVYHSWLGRAGVSKMQTDSWPARRMLCGGRTGCWRGQARCRAPLGSHTCVPSHPPLPARCSLRAAPPSRVTLMHSTDPSRCREWRRADS